MKKLLVLVLTIISAVTMCFSLVACGGGEECKHTYSTKWTDNATHHWKAATCGCDVKKDYGAHDFSVEGIEVNNQIVYECSVCGMSEDKY